MEFSRRNPIVNLIYFVAVTTITAFFMNPVLLALSMLAAFSYMILLSGGKRALKSLALLLPMSALGVVVNVLFNHRGATILTYLPNGNPITQEALLYGVAAAAMIVAVIWWFNCLTEIMTSDKIMYLFGMVIPSLSLIFSMILRFVPRFKKQFLSVAGTQNVLGIKTNTPKGMSAVMSAVTSWAIEGSAETADSMKARGYGSGKRTAFAIFKFTLYDFFCVLYIAATAVYTIVGKESLQFEFYPRIAYAEPTIFQISIYAAFCLMAAMPLVTEAAEVIRWKYLRLKI